MRHFAFLIPQIRASASSNLEYQTLILRRATIFNGHFMYAINIFISEVKTPRFYSLAPDKNICHDYLHRTEKQNEECLILTSNKSIYLITDITTKASNFVVLGHTEKYFYLSLIPSCR